MKQHAIHSIDDVVSSVNSLRQTQANIPSNPLQSKADNATVAARLAYGYPKEPPDQTDCFVNDVRRQCLRIIKELYSGEKATFGSAVYLISTENPAFVKIGYTSCLEHRLRSLRTASHVEPTVLLAIQGTRSLERKFHTRFAATHHDREWFRLTDELKSFIASNREV